MRLQDHRRVSLALLLCVAAFGLASSASSIANWLAQVALELGLASLALASVPLRGLRAALERLGWRRGRLGRGRQALAVALCLGIVAAFALLVDPDLPQPEIARPFAGRWGFVAVFASLVVLPAVCEELLFRGALQRALTERHGSSLAIAATSLLFAFMHVGAGVHSMVFALVLGSALSVMTDRSGSTREAMLVHAINNAAYFAMRFG